MAKKRIDTKTLIQKIEKITKERITKGQVVNLKEFRDVKMPKEPYTVLVIEDDESMRNAMKRILESEGLEVICAADGTQLSKVLDDSPIDLVMMDIGLPWINGLELAQLMKENDDLKKIPLIFVSGKASELDVKRGFSVGADDYITKPFDVEKVKKAVRTLLRLAN